MRVLLALALAGGAIALIAVALNHLVRAGTCASGGPYQIARQCPKGTGTWMFVIPPALIALFAAVIVSGKGSAAGRAVWCGAFVALGIDAVVLRLDGGLGAGAGSRFGAVVLAVTFLTMGLIPGIVWTASWFRNRDEPRTAGGEGGSPWRSAAGGSKADVLAQLESVAAQSRGGFTRVGDTGDIRDSVLAAVARGSAFGPPGPKAPADPIDRLQQLVRLREAGVLTDAEFTAQKARILGEA